MSTMSGAVIAFALVFLVVSTSAASLPLPEFISPCARDDPKLNECALERGKTVIAHLKDGLPKYHIPRLEPLHVEEIKINQDEKSGVGINLVAKNVDIHGVSEGELRDIRIQLDPTSFKLSIFFPRIEIMSKYNVNGKILILPIQGDGNANITMVNLELGFDFTAELNKKKDSQNYLKLGEHQITYKMSRNYIKMDNLFNGNKALGDRMNEFMDVNWREVTEELGPPIADALALVIKSIIAGILEQVPYENIFPVKA
ncbi:protein takeout-like [Hetaerina americana]|uniref:protein takeout-like n=1 Tax=Hetaerina americana TaxID=62018 RepID=UPI003A7F1A70